MYVMYATLLYVDHVDLYMSSYHSHHVLWIIQAYHDTYVDMFFMLIPWPPVASAQETRPEIPWKSMLVRRKLVNLQASVPYTIQDAKDSELGVCIIKRPENKVKL